MWPRVAHRFGLVVMRMPFAVPAAATAVLFAIVAYPIVGSPYWGDDMFDSQIPMMIQHAHVGYVDSFAYSLHGLQERSGRFSPVSVVWALAVWSTFDSRESYKAFEFAIVAVAMMALFAFTALAVRNRWLGLLTTLVAITGLQMRQWYDPYWQFSGLMPMLVILLLLSGIAALLAVRSHGRLAVATAAAAAVICFAGAGLAYEPVIPVGAASMILIFGERAPLMRRVAVATVLAGTASALLVNFLYWRRTVASHIGPEFAASLSPMPLAKAAAVQAVGAVPSSYAVLGDQMKFRFDWIAASTFLLAIVLIAAAAARAGAGRLRCRRGLIAYGLACIAFPAAAVAASSRWQAELQPGLAYIPVMIETVGVAIIVSVATATIVASRRTAREAAALRIRPSTLRYSAILVVAAFLAAGAAAAAVGNRQIATNPSFVDIQARRDAFETAVRHGLFNRPVPSNAVIVRPVTEWFTWENPWFVDYYGGPKNLEFVTPENASAALCGSRTCIDLILDHDGAHYAYRLAPHALG